MTMFQMLAKVVCAEEFLGLVAFTKFVYTGEMGDTVAPIRLRLIGKFLTAVTAHVHGSNDV